MTQQVVIETDRDKEGGLSFIRGHGTYQVGLGVLMVTHVLVSLVYRSHLAF